MYEIQHTLLTHMTRLHWHRNVGDLYFMRKQSDGAAF